MEVSLRSSHVTKIAGLLALGTALAGCYAAPPVAYAPAPPPAQVVYQQPYYAAPAYYAPAYYGPGYYGPAVGVNLRFGGGGRGWR